MKKSKGKNLSSQKGITLIALVITIIILIILAGISIRLVLGEDGIVQKVQQAALKTEMATLYEDLQQKVLTQYVEYQTNQGSNDYLNFLITEGYVVEEPVEDNAYVVTVEAVLGRNLKSGNGTYPKDVYVIKVEDAAQEGAIQEVASIASLNNDSNNFYKASTQVAAENSNGKKNLSLYYYDEKGTAIYVGILATTSGTVNTEISAVPSDFWQITEDGAVSVNSKYISSSSNGYGYSYGYMTSYGYNHDIVDENGDSITEIVIPSQVNGIKVTSIGESAFYRCIYLRSVTIPNSVTTIKKSAFDGCGLLNVTIPNSVTTIEDSAFSACMSLSNVTIPNSVTIIGNSAFKNCQHLTTITIPSSVTTIGDYAFCDCIYLETVYFEHTEEPSFGSNCFLKNYSYTTRTTFYFKNSIVANAFTTDNYSESFGQKSIDYDW